MKKTTSIFDTSFIRFICKQPYIITCFALCLLISSGLLLLLLLVEDPLHKAPVFWLSFFTLLFAYIAIGAGISYYRIFALLRRLRQKHVDYQVEDIVAEISQDGLNIYTPGVGIVSREVALPVSPQKVSIIAIDSAQFIVLLIWYKEAGLYKKLAKPLWIDVENGCAWQELKPKGMRRMRKEEVKRDNNDLLLTITSLKNDFRQARLVNFFSAKRNIEAIPQRLGF